MPAGMRHVAATHHCGSRQADALDNGPVGKRFADTCTGGVCSAPLAGNMLCASRDRTHRKRRSVMAAQTNLYAGLAGYVGRPDQKGSVGVFRRAGGADWQHVLTNLETFAVMVHPADPALVLAGTADGVWRSTDRGAPFARAKFPAAGKQIWSFLVDARAPKRIYAGGSPVDIYRSDDSGESWRRLPHPAIKDRVTGPFSA